MQLFKAHFIHPHTGMPMIIYYNKSNGYVTFEKDNEVLKIFLHLDKDLARDDQFVSILKETTNMSQTEYPVDSFEDVYELLESLGVSKEELTFTELIMH
ncbi:hypothetical protein GN156_13940 [bacterium LRH843]|nr:hypothetical protein [bacterium LRH843]